MATVICVLEHLHVISHVQRTELSCLNVVQGLFITEEGSLPHAVDQVMEDFGFPLGGFKTADMSGKLDVLSFSELTYIYTCTLCLCGSF